MNEQLGENKAAAAVQWQEVGAECDKSAVSVYDLLTVNSPFHCVITQSTPDGSIC